MRCGFRTCFSPNQAYLISYLWILNFDIEPDRLCFDRLGPLMRNSPGQEISIFGIWGPETLTTRRANDPKRVRPAPALERKSLPAEQPQRKLVERRHQKRATPEQPQSSPRAAPEQLLSIPRTAQAAPEQSSSRGP